MAQRRSARPHKKVLHETSDDDLLEDSEKELTSADVLVKAHPVVEDEKTAKIQEKNRRAQRKFRERRKERMNHMEKSIISLNDQIKALKVENKMFKELLTVKERQLQVAKVGDKSPNSFSYPDYDPIDMSWLPGYGDAALSNEKIRHMSDEELTQMCMKIFTMLDQQLRMCETSNPSGVDQAKITALVKGGTGFWARCLLVEPVRTREIVGRIQATRQSGDKSPQATPQAVGSKMIQELGLSPEQMRQMSQAWMKYKAALEQMLGDREACSKELMSLRPDPDNEMRNLQIFLQENKVVEQLRSTMQRENKLFLECMHEVAHKTLNPLQLARFILYGKPYMDMLSLCKAVAVEMEGEESAQLRPSARQRSVLCTALDNVGAPTTWLDSDLQSDLKALGGRLQVAQNPLAPVASGSHQSHPASCDLRSRQHSPLHSTGSPLTSTQTLPAVNANHNTLYEGLAHYRSNRSQFGELPAPTPLDSQSVFAMQAPDKAATAAVPMSTASKERNMLLQDIFSTYHTNNSNTINNVTDLPPGHGGFQSGVMTANQMQVSGAEIFNRPQPSSQQQLHAGDPFARDPRHQPLDGESAFMAPGINSAGNSISLGEAAARARRSQDASLASLGRTDHPEPHDVANASADRLGLPMPQPSPSLDMFANYEPNGSMFQDTGLMSRFTSTSLHLMESCELRADQRNDTLMNMIDRLPNVPTSSAAAHHAALADVFDAAGMSTSSHGTVHGHGAGVPNPSHHATHAMQPSALQPVTTGGTLYHGHL